LQPNYLMSQFPEALFKTRKEDYAVYESRIQRGFSTAFSSNLVICGLARDIRPYISYLYNRVLHLGSFFKDYSVVIVENDSIDGTREELEKIQQTNHRWMIIGEKQGKIRHCQDKSLRRRIDMAFYRNQYLNFVNAHYGKPLYPDIPTYMIILDTDLLGGYSYEGVLNSIGYEQQWDFIGSNGLLFRKRDNRFERLFYDTWAFRKYGSWNDIGKAGNLFLWERGDEPERVFSCFGGCGIYKWDSIKNLRYNETDCDCVTLHKQMIENGKYLFMNPSQITLYNNHQYCSELE